MRFIHTPLGFNTELKVVKLTKSHPYLNEPVEVEFSNAKADFIQIQQQTAGRMKQVNNLIKGGSLGGASFSMPENYSDIVGVTSMREIEKGQHTQELTNQKMDFTLDSINREREIEKQNKEDSRKEFKQLKWLIASTVATLFGSLVFALIRTWLGV